MQERGHNSLENRTTLSWPVGSAVKVVSDALHANEDVTVISERFSILPYQSGERIDIIVSPALGLYSANDLNDFTRGLVPGLTREEKKSNDFSGDITSGLRLGRDSYIDPLGEILETTSWETTVFDAHAMKRLDREQITVTREKVSDIDRTTNVRVYPNETIGTMVAAYEHAIQYYGKRGLVVADAYLESLRRSVSLDMVEGLAEEIERLGSMDTYLSAVASGKSPFDEQVSYDAVHEFRNRAHDVQAKGNSRLNIYNRFEYPII